MSMEVKLSHALEPVHLVTGPNYAPFADPSLPKGGLATAVVSAAFEEVGYKTSYDWKPWKRGYIESKNGRFVGTFPYIVTKERQKDFLYSDPIFTQSYVALTHMDENANLSSFEKMRGKTICRPIGYAIAEKIADQIKKRQIRVFEPAQMTGCIKALLHLTGHVVILNKLQAKDVLEKNASHAKKFKVHPLNERGFTLHFIISKHYNDAKGWMGKFNQGLKKIRTSGRYNQLNSEFGLVD